MFKPPKAHPLTIAMLVIIPLVLLVLVACTDANFDAVTRYNNPSHIECYQYDIKTLDDTSTGKVEFAENSNQFYYRSKQTNKLVQVINMSCTIKEI